jgi:hypothetical protein
MANEVESKTLGLTSEATLITPIRSGMVPGENRTYQTRLTHSLESLARRAEAGINTPIPLLRTIHSARWHIYEAPPGPPLLIFSVSFDGDLKHYFRRFSHGIPDDVDRIWGNCEGYPKRGAHDFEALWRWVKLNQVKALAFYHANPDLTLTDIKRLRLSSGISIAGQIGP